MPGIVLAGGDMAVNKVEEVPAPMGLSFQQINKQTL